MLGYGVCRALLLSLKKVCTFIDEQRDALRDNGIRGAKYQILKIS